MTLLEVMVATAMLTTVLTAVSVLLRTSYAAWSDHEEDLSRVRSGHAALWHIVRHVRQGESVATLPTDTPASTSLSVTMPSGSTYAWGYDSVNDEVLFGTTTADQLLAENITSLSFTGYEADATTVTTVAADVHVLRTTIEYALPTGATESVSCIAWLRSY